MCESKKQQPTQISPSTTIILMVLALILLGGVGITYVQNQMEQRQANDPTAEINNLNPEGNTTSLLTEDRHYSLPKETPLNTQIMRAEQSFDKARAIHKAKRTPESRVAYREAEKALLELYHELSPEEAMKRVIDGAPAYLGEPNKTFEEVYLNRDQVPNR